MCRTLCFQDENRKSSNFNFFKLLHALTVLLVLGVISKCTGVLVLHCTIRVLAMPSPDRSTSGTVLFARSRLPRSILNAHYTFSTASVAGKWQGILNELKLFRAGTPEKTNLCFVLITQVRFSLNDVGAIPDSNFVSEQKPLLLVIVVWATCNCAQLKIIRTIFIESFALICFYFWSSQTISLTIKSCWFGSMMWLKRLNSATVQAYVGYRFGAFKTSEYPLFCCFNFCSSFNIVNFDVRKLTNFLTLEIYNFPGLY